VNLGVDLDSKNEYGQTSFFLTVCCQEFINDDENNSEVFNKENNRNELCHKENTEHNPSSNPIIVSDASLVVAGTSVTSEILSPLHKLIIGISGPCQITQLLETGAQFF
jgi:hypothetical protein